MLEVIRTRMGALMGPILQAISGECTIVVTADHGFVERDGGHIHGGDSYFERVVPFSEWKRSEN